MYIEALAYLIGIASGVAMLFYIARELWRIEHP
jgi:hypothetical protein